MFMAVFGLVGFMISLLAEAGFSGIGARFDRIPKDSLDAFAALLPGAAVNAIVFGSLAFTAIRCQSRMTRSAAYFAAPALLFSAFLLSFLYVIVPPGVSLSACFSILSNGSEVRSFNGAMIVSVFWACFQSLLLLAFVGLLTLGLIISILRNVFRMRVIFGFRGLQALGKHARRSRIRVRGVSPRSRMGSLWRRSFALVIFGSGSFFVICIFVALLMALGAIFGLGAEPPSEAAMKEIIEALKGGGSLEEIGQLTKQLDIVSISTIISLWGPASTAIIILPLGLIYWFRSGMGIRYWKEADSLLQPAAETVLAMDERRPVVVLRTFADDDISLIADNVVSGAMRPVVRMEEAVVPFLRSLGPVVAIGQPKERIPRLGADRAYFSGDDWQAAISRWIEMAALIVVFAGKGEGLRWELREIAKANAWNKTLIVFPSVSGVAKQELWQELRHAWSPIIDKVPINDIETTTMVSLFGSAPVLITGSGRRVSDYEAAAILACEIYLQNDRVGDAVPT
jgi:hypothetical protein